MTDGQLTDFILALCMLLIVLWLIILTLRGR